MAPKEKTEDIVDLDPILIEIGQFGKYQIINYLYIVVAIMFSAIYVSQYIFAAGAVDYRCNVPQCEAIPPNFDESWVSIALPTEGINAQCSRYAPLLENGTCSPESFLRNVTVSCEAWVYGSHDTIVSEFNLACQEWKRTLVGTIHSIGQFAALPLTGYISDTFGRRTALCLTAVMASILGIIRSFSTTYIMYLIFEFLDATLGSGVYSTGFILGLELVGLDRRVLGGNLISMSFAVGQVILALVAWWIPYWRTLTRVLYAPSLLFIVYFFLIDESVRWLLSKGRKKEAAKIIFRAAETNKRTLSKQTLISLKEKEIDSKDQNEIEGKTTESLFCQVIKSKIILGRLCVCSFWWITVTFTYYGLSINSVSLAGNSYVNYMLTSLVEIPGYTLSILTLDRFGRKSSIMTAFFICGISLFSLPFIPESLPWLATTLSMIGKLFISSVFSSIYIYTSELFPTNSRHSLLGFCSFIGRIGSIIAPQTPLLMLYMESLPYLIFGTMSTIAGFLVLLAPETLRAHLPDTIAEAESITTKPKRVDGHVS